ncbi:hypothetical protein BC830DRAFT_1175540 [Chytriomyces sp. MP71]|nr:hypothetical protein BC830DRAFT_1175540 [Chytriomyces sp. MP71]
MLHLIMTAVLAAVFGTLAVDASCAMTMGTCQIQQDPIVTPFNGKNFNLTSAGTFFALQSDEMSVQVSVMEAFSDRLGRVVHSVQQVTYTCGAQVDTWDLPRIMAGGPATLKCTVGGCGVTGVVCRVALVKGSSPVENVNVQEVVYFGSTGVGGLCYRGDASCFAAGDVSGGTVPDRAAGTTVFEALSQTAVAQSGEASMEPNQTVGLNP